LPDAGLDTFRVGVSGGFGAITLVAVGRALCGAVNVVYRGVGDLSAERLAVDVTGGAGIKASLSGRLLGGQSNASGGRSRRSGGILGGGNGDKTGEDSSGETHFDGTCRFVDIKT